MAMSKRPEGLLWYCSTVCGYHWSYCTVKSTRCVGCRGPGESAMRLATSASPDPVATFLQWERASGVPVHTFPFFFSPSKNDLPDSRLSRLQGFSRILQILGLLFHLARLIDFFLYPHLTSVGFKDVTIERTRRLRCRC